MAEYINREEVCKLCDNKKEYCGKEKCPVYKAPANDVVEVVRCKDCKHYEEDFCWRWGGVRHSEHFCSYGERREGE